MFKRNLTIQLASPRGFCAGVDRAIAIVEKALEKFGKPVYVRHEIVHNKYVVQELCDKGAIFVEKLDEVPNDSLVIFSAHGVPKSVPAAAQKRGLTYLDATCPLVTKVHVDAARHKKEGRTVLLIGHSGHPEVIGTLGQFPKGEMLLIENIGQAKSVKVEHPDNLSYVTQTTLSLDDTAEIIEVLQGRFPNIESPRTEDICYATTNRQAAVKALTQTCDAIVVIGALNSSNSNRLKEVSQAAGCPKSILIDRAEELDIDWLCGVHTLGITAGASAPEILVQELITRLKTNFNIKIEEVFVTSEDIDFSLPRALID
ncbi:MAG: 4-hydroxy-3-methylbut-2-enyl diphosphate reductase [Rhodospirillaceae bacterium]|nr:4-hydroxy-3-methylbut-2-enyl diphosphate reductase [Rhodospirillaceae bacterium]|tara:strand:- start:2566 stop:3510 length:945 start_codon:yes stop_codon:yes gene_type:complete